MPRPNRERDAALAELYARIPALDCQGLCWRTCGPIAMSVRESQRARAAGFKIPDERKVTHQEETYVCPALTRDRRCAIYAIRPTVCRLWGVAQGLTCIHGCRPQYLLSKEESFLLLAEALVIGGGDSGLPGEPPMSVAEAREWLASPEGAALIEDHWSKGMTLDYRRHFTVPEDFQVR